MYLKKIIIFNYKSCQKIELDLIKDDPLVLIGINDCGKSTILRAIDLLFDG
jgi:predicted ATP-dependent endonuclease of OLD family